MKAPTKKSTAEKLRRWRVTIIRQRAHHLAGQTQRDDGAGPATGEERLQQFVAACDPLRPRIAEQTLREGLRTAEDDTRRRVELFVCDGLPMKRETRSRR